MNIPSRWNLYASRYESMFQDADKFYTDIVIQEAAISFFPLFNITLDNLCFTKFYVTEVEYWVLKRPIKHINLPNQKEKFNIFKI